MSNYEFPEPAEFRMNPPIYISEEITPDGVVVTLDKNGRIEQTPPLSIEVVIAAKHGLWRQPEGGIQ